MFDVNTILGGGSVGGEDYVFYTSEEGYDWDTRTCEVDTGGVRVMARIRRYIFFRFAYLYNFYSIK